MRSEVKHAFALYERKTGTEKQQWRCIGVSNRRKDMARLAGKAAELYYDPVIDTGVDLGRMVSELHLRSYDYGVGFENTDGTCLDIDYKIKRIPIDDISRKTIRI